MPQSARYVVTAVGCFALGVLIGRSLPGGGDASGVRGHQRMAELETAVLRHVMKAAREFATTSDVDVVLETVDRQPTGKVMVVGFCRLVTPNEGGANGGRFWVEVSPTEEDGGYEVRDIATEYGTTEHGLPWAKRE